MTGLELRELREALGWTIAEFAKRVGYSWSQIQRMEVGRRNVTDRFVSNLKTRGYFRRAKHKHNGGNQHVTPRSNAGNSSRTK
jgi:predicted transcriptional regulator